MQAPLSKRIQHSSVVGYGLVAFLACAAATLAQGEPAEAAKSLSEEGPSFRVCSVLLIDECFQDHPGMSIGGRTGTTVSFVVTQPNAKILTFEKDASRIRSFSDDTGKNLVAASFSRGADLECRSGTGISKDGHTAVIEVAARSLPGVGAREIYIDGNLEFMQATERKIVIADNVRLEVGERGTLGDISFEVLQKEAQTYYDDPKSKDSVRKVYTLTIETRGPDPNAIESFRVLDANGREISQSRGRGRSQTNNFVRGSFSLTIPESMAAGRLEAAYWPNPTKVNVPIKATVGVGF